MPCRTDNLEPPEQLLLPLGVAAPATLWRPIHYLGSKLRLTGAIQSHLAELDPSCGPVCDLFAGSGTVANALSRVRRVVAADIQEYSRVLCTALLQPAILNQSLVRELAKLAGDRFIYLESLLAPILDLEQRALETAPSNPELLCELIDRGSDLTSHPADSAAAQALRESMLRLEQESANLVATSYFGGVYFSYRQALHIDCYLYAIDRLPLTVRNTCLAAVLSTASDIVNSIGKQFAQPMQPRRKDGTVKRHVVEQMIRDRALDFASLYSKWLARYTALPRSDGHRIVRADYRDVLNGLTDVSIVYADPPYTRDHYSRFYHVLETLALRDRPGISTTLLTGQGAKSRGIYRTDRHQSPFSIKSQARGAFAELFKGCSNLGLPLLVSYSPYVKSGHPRLMTVDAIMEVAREYYSRVQVKEAHGFAHSKLNKTELHLEASENAEVLICCRH
jgi:adenine-specific DNA-methyltransferase